MSDDFITLINFKEFKHSSKKTKVLDLSFHYQSQSNVDMFVTHVFPLFPLQNFSIKDMFIRHLIQLKNLSVEKAIAIVGRYPTPQALIQAAKFGGHEGMFADIPCLGTATSRNVGPVTSKAVHFMYTTEKLH